MGMIGNSLAQGLISGANIQDGTVDTPDIKDSAVTAAKIASAVVTPAKMDFSAGTANGITYLNGSKALTTGSALVFDGTNLGVGTSSPSAPIAIGRVNSAEEGGQIDLCRASDNASSWGIDVFGSTSTPSLRFIDNVASATRMSIDGSGNVGIGCTPSSWSTVVPVLQIGGAGGYVASQGNAEVLRIGSNNYYSGGWKYVITGGATRYDQSAGAHSWHTAASGSANAAASFTQAMTLDASGNFHVGAATRTAKFNVVKSGGGTNPSVSPTLPANAVAWIEAAGGDGLAIGQYTNSHIWFQAAYSLPVNGNPYPYNIYFQPLGGSVIVSGSLSKGSGSFRISHPLPELNETHELVHSFIEGPQADLIYRGKVSLVGGVAAVNIDLASGMTEGTFVALNREVQCFTTNESDWTAVKGSVVGNILTIEAQDSTCTASISWMVIGERQDQHMYDTEWTDENGKVIVEPLKPVDTPAPEEEVTE